MSESTPTVQLTQVLDYQFDLDFGGATTHLLAPAPERLGLGSDPARPIRILTRTNENTLTFRRGGRAPESRRGPVGPRWDRGSCAAGPRFGRNRARAPSSGQAASCRTSDGRADPRAAREDARKSRG